MAARAGSHRKMVFGKWKMIGGRKGKGKKRHAKRAKRAKRRGGPLVHVGNAVFRVKKLVNCTPTGGPEHALRCDVDVFKTAVRRIKTFPMHPQHQLPGIMGLSGRRGKRRGKRR
jgi:hypothetical protein